MHIKNNNLKIVEKLIGIIYIIICININYIILCLINNYISKVLCNLLSYHNIHHSRHKDNVIAKIVLFKILLYKIKCDIYTISITSVSCKHSIVK